MFIPARYTGIRHRYFKITAIAITAIIIAGFVPRYTLRLLRHDPFLTLLVQAHGAPGAPFYLRLVAFDGVNLLLFACLAAWAVAMRSRAAYHKRLMLLATLSLLGPAFGRLTEYTNGFSGGSDLAVLLLMLGFLGACVMVDTLSLRRLHPAWIFGALPVAIADLVTYIARTQL